MPGHTALVLSGGGSRGVAVLGALRALKQGGALTYIERYVGTSAGAVIAAGMALGHDPEWTLQKKVLPTSLDLEWDFDCLETGFGLDSGTGLQKWIDSVLGCKKYTFAELPSLVVCATNVSRREPVYFSAETHPSMDVGLALRISCSIPLLFTAVRFQGDVYVDGCASDNFPLTWATSRGYKTLGLCIESVPGPITTLTSFLGALLGSSLRRDTPPQATVLALPIGTPATSLNFKLPREELLHMFREGHDIAMKSPILLRTPTETPKKDKDK